MQAGGVVGRLHAPVPTAGLALPAVTGNFFQRLWMSCQLITDNKVYCSRSLAIDLQHHRAICSYNRSTLYPEFLIGGVHCTVPTKSREQAFFGRVRNRIFWYIRAFSFLFLCHRPPATPLPPPPLPIHPHPHATRSLHPSARETEFHPMLLLLLADASLLLPHLWLVPTFCCRP